MDFLWQRVPFGALGFDLFAYVRRSGSDGYGPPDGKVYIARVTLHPKSVELTVSDLDGNLRVRETLRRHPFEPVEDSYLAMYGFEGVKGWEER